MDFDEYRKRGKEMVDYIANYLENIRERRVFPDVKPGYMHDLVPESPPLQGEAWEDIFGDVERVIMPGITHWQSPHMHAYFPALNSFPSLLGDMLADAIGCLGFTWASSPACTELETIVMDWLGKMIGLPAEFLHSNQQTKGGGVIQTTASDATFVALLAARSMVIKKYRAMDNNLEDAEINSRLVMYCSDQAHSSVEKASLIGLVKLRLLPSNDSLSLCGQTLRDAIEEDRSRGLIPFFVCATLGTTGACNFDNLEELGPVCEKEEMWMHIDAAYAGTAFLCPEYRHYLKGVEYAESFAFNPSKWMMVNFDCTAMWVKNSGALHRTFNVEPIYLQHENTGAAIDYMHWQIALSRRFRALKLWFVIRSFGVKGLQQHVRKGIRLGMKFERLVRQDPRFEIPSERILGLVVFRLKGDNVLTEHLLKKINARGKLHMVPATFKGQYVLRFTVTSQYTTEDDILRDWTIIRSTANEILQEAPEAPVLLHVNGEAEKMLPNMEAKNRKDFGMSLLLFNVPMSPKFINGSFAALFDSADLKVEFLQQYGDRDLTRLLPLSPRKRLKKASKQLSLDVDSSRIPFRPSRYLRSYQKNSLDSKIEEIFELTLEDEAAKEQVSADATSDEVTPLPAQPEKNGIEKKVCEHCGSVLNCP
ncbi:histidine decarboxylase-like [Lingula anatina]|uniref:Histidine decarboxylase n=1 Tax=Lingula anatina TaxID=7574 RepID=A0A1S3ITY6_LINAN|nr:histidine decarboxylase-like [Lingula anatina]|eukprot:XP_013401543.1 histidine decarboxylase-like [Lingula anatina]